MAFGWIGRPHRSRPLSGTRSVGCELPLRLLPRRCPFCPDPAKAISGRPRRAARTKTGTFFPPSTVSYSENEVKRHEAAVCGPQPTAQWRALSVADVRHAGSVVRPFRANAGDGMPQRASCKRPLAIHRHHDRRRGIGKRCRAWAAVCPSVFGGAGESDDGRLAHSSGSIGLHIGGGSLVSGRSTDTRAGGLAARAPKVPDPCLAVRTDAHAAFPAASRAGWQ